MEKTLEKIKRIYPLSDIELDLLVRELTKIKIQKNTIIIREGKIARSLYFIEKGIAMAYLDGRENRITFWFGTEGDFFLSFNSYINQKPGYENIELLEDSEVYEIKTEVLERLYQSNTALANWGRKLAEIELIKTEERYIARLFKTAKERYIELLVQYPTLVQRVKLGHIASYLGITQVTLSRIRSDIAKS